MIEGAMSVTKPHGGSTADQMQWLAVLERDSAQDGKFVYAVASTRIYCRPSCPSRRPDRNRVRFFPTPAAAEASGYRECRRCEPKSSHRRSDRQALRARGYLDEHWNETVTLAELGR